VNGFKESFDTEEAERHGITRNAQNAAYIAGFAVAEEPEEESATEEEEELVEAAGDLGY
jgi:hypothetical protein